MFILCYIFIDLSICFVLDIIFIFVPLFLPSFCSLSFFLFNSFSFSCFFFFTFFSYFLLSHSLFLSYSLLFFFFFLLLSYSLLFLFSNPIQCNVIINVQLAFVQQEKATIEFQQSGYLIKSIMLFVYNLILLFIINYL